MKQKILASLWVLSPVIWVGCAESPAVNTRVAEPETSTVAATPTELSLLASIHEERRKSGKSELMVSNSLVGLARAESNASAISGQTKGESAERLQMRSGFGTVGRMQGVLKDRGPQTGSGFVSYWVKDDSELLAGEWSKVGVGVSKSADGRLFAVVILGRDGGGGSLMQPPMRPSGL